MIPNDVPVGGVTFQWRSDYPSGDQETGIRPDGEFLAKIPGEYTITAAAAGAVASVNLKVSARKKVQSESSVQQQTIRQVSSSSIGPLRDQTSSAQVGQTANADNFVDGDPYSWNSSNKHAASGALNQRGEAGGLSTVGASSSNFRIEAPVISLPGRGLDLDLNLVYNSRVWSKANNPNNEIVYDADQDQIAPGWTLGFGKIINMIDAGAFIIEANGARHSYSGTVATDIWGTRTFRGTTTDGTFIEYAVITKGLGTSTVRTWGWAKYPNGTTVAYTGLQTANPPHNLYVLTTASINDNNGNYISFNPQNGKLRNIKDTLGRVVTFHYATNDLLTAITAAGLKDDAGVVTTRTLVRLHYKPLTMSFTFEGLTPVVRNPTVWAIDAIYYPDTKTGYWFDDEDSYSSYGMIRKVSVRKGMGFSDAPLTEQGTIQPGVATKELVYNYPLGPVGNLTGAPACASKIETWEGSTTGQAETQYDVQEEGDSRIVTTTLPDQSKTVEFSYIHPSQYDDGLVYKVEVRDQSDHVLRTKKTTWEPGVSFIAFGPKLAPRVKRVDFTDELGQTKFHVYVYVEGVGPHIRNQIKELKEYDYSGNLMRKTVWTYHDGYIRTRLDGDLNPVSADLGTTNAVPCHFRCGAIQVMGRKHHKLTMNTTILAINLDPIFSTLCRRYGSRPWCNSAR